MQEEDTSQELFYDAESQPMTLTQNDFYDADSQPFLTQNGAAAAEMQVAENSSKLLTEENESENLLIDAEKIHHRRHPSLTQNDAQKEIGDEAVLSNSENLIESESQNELLEAAKDGHVQPKLDAVDYFAYFISIAYFIWAIFARNLTGFS